MSRWEKLCSLACLGLSRCIDNCIVIDNSETLATNKSLLGECQGGCNSDLDCSWGLNCFFQHSPNDRAPGCKATTRDSATNYCYVPPAGELVLMSDGEENATVSLLLGECQGDCDSDLDCDYGLACFQRDGMVMVDGCNGTGIDGKDYCYKPPPGTLILKGDDMAPVRNFPLGVCEGDCDEDSDCAGDLRCFQRSGTETIPGCVGEGIFEMDYCFDGEWFLGKIRNPSDSDAMFEQMSIDVLPNSNGEPPLVVRGDNGSPSYPLGECQGDCDSDLDCEYGLSCFHTMIEGLLRRHETTVDGCNGFVTSYKDYCYSPPLNTLVRMGRDKEPAESYPLDMCQGDCNDDSDCAGNLRCFHRTGTEAVPGCTGEGVAGWNYCYDDGWVPGTITYLPGHGTVHQNGLKLSTGLLSRVIASTGSPVRFDVGGGSSTDRFHRAPDGAAVFSRPETDGWVYVSNSEAITEGGVGAIYFNSKGQVTGYKRILSGTNRNCGGGKSFWNTWISCEENDEGQIYEVDPWGSYSQVTVIGDDLLANYESCAYDNRNINHPTFYVTVDELNGPLLRFTPATAAVEYAIRTGDYKSLLTTTGDGLKYEYLVLDYDTSNSGTFSWTTKKVLARMNAREHFSGLEGIDIRDGILFMTAKVEKKLFILDLDEETFKETSTASGAFDGEPDQVARIVGTDMDDLLYFCEDGGFDCGVHARDGNGNYYTILQTDVDPNTNGGVDMSGETSGLAFSPDNMFMYVSFQTKGRILEVRRADGLPFDGQRIDIKYHNEDSSF